MRTVVFDRRPRQAGACSHALPVVLMVLMLSACANPFDASTSTRFDSSSDKAIVLVGTSVSRVQADGAGGPRRLETYWQEYDPNARRLRPEGESFVTEVSAGPVAKPEYLTPTVSVLEIDPGDYALIGAGFPHEMTLYVQSKDSLSRSRNSGSLQSWTFTVDPRRHVDPEAEVDPRRNMVFSVEAGQIVYIGHLRFEKRTYIDSLASISYSQDKAAAREALAGYPAISGEMVTLDLRRPAQSVSR